MTDRLLSKRQALSHMERREQVVEFEAQSKPAIADKEKQKAEIERLENKYQQEKEIQLY
jgi:hypothetical protein